MWTVEDAKKIGYVTGKNTSSNFQRHCNAWFDWCAKHNHPYVEVRILGNGSNNLVHMDLLEYDRKLSELQIAELIKLTKPFMPKYQQTHCEKHGFPLGGDYHIGSMVVYLKVPAEHSSRIARRIIEYAQNGDPR